MASSAQGGIGKWINTDYIFSVFGSPEIMTLRGKSLWISELAVVRLLHMVAIGHNFSPLFLKLIHSIWFDNFSDELELGCVISKIKSLGQIQENYC